MEPRAPRPQPKPRAVLCPYCGGVSHDLDRCDHCAGFFDPLSRQASQNHMGPWFIRDDLHPNRPGCSYETIRELAARGRLQPGSILRGPGTNQFWCLAKRTPGVAHLLGLCHNCQAPARADEILCSQCGTSFHADADRQHLGLLPMRLLPGQAPAGIIAAASTPLSQRETDEADAPPPLRAEPAPKLETLAPFARRTRSGAAPWIIFSLLAASAIAIAYWFGARHGAKPNAPEPGPSPAIASRPIAPGSDPNRPKEALRSGETSEERQAPRPDEDTGPAEAPTAPASLWDRLEPLLREDSASSLATVREIVRMEHEQGRLTDEARDQLLDVLTRRESLKKARELP